MKVLYISTNLFTSQIVYSVDQFIVINMNSKELVNEERRAQQL